MKIAINDNNEIISFATVGEIDNGIEVEDTIIPEGFREDFRPKKFLYVNEEITINPNYVAPENEELPTAPSMQDEVDSLRAQVEQLTAMLEQLMNKQE